MNLLTVFTPTYNRAHTLGNLYQSLLKQTDHRFEWLIIDDGSIDTTQKMIDSWLKTDTPFPISYLYCENGGKQRAINHAVRIINTEYIFIVDSDDQLTENAVELVNGWLSSIEGREDLAGVSGVKGDMEGRPLGRVSFDQFDYIEATNLERTRFNLQHDMAEVYKTDLLRQFPFEVWPGETFVPEATVWDEIALRGYKLQWHQDVIYKCEYLEDGLTNNSWQLLKKNPMGYAMLFNHQLSTEHSFRELLKKTILMISCVFLAGEKEYLKRSNKPLLTKMLIPAGKLLARRRTKQFSKMGLY